MSFRVLWSFFAEEQIDLIFKYYKSEANLKVAKQIIANLVSATDSLKDNPNLGQVEELLKSRNEIYRYLVCKNYKIIYSVDQDLKLIKIADVFDTRQNPVKMICNK